jgi:hypothetical protein
MTGHGKVFGLEVKLSIYSESMIPIDRIDSHSTAKVLEPNSRHGKAEQILTW